MSLHFSWKAALAMACCIATTGCAPWKPWLGSKANPGATPAARTASNDSLDHLVEGGPRPQPARAPNDQPKAAAKSSRSMFGGDNTKKEAAKQAEVDSELAMARLGERRGQSDNAKTLYKKIIEKHPQHPGAYHRLGVLHAQDGNFIEANRCFEHGITVSPPTIEMLSDMGYCYYLQSRFDDAERVLRDAHRQKPNHESTCNNLGLVYGAQGRFAESLEMFQRVNTEAEAYANLAYVFTQQGDLNNAKKGYVQALTLDAKLRQAAKAVIQVDERLKQHEQTKANIARQNPVSPAPNEQSQAQAASERPHAAEERQPEPANGGYVIAPPQERVRAEEPAIVAPLPEVQSRRPAHTANSEPRRPEREIEADPAPVPTAPATRELVTAPAATQRPRSAFVSPAPKFREEVTESKQAEIAAAPQPKPLPQATQSPLASTTLASPKEPIARPGQKPTEAPRAVVAVAPKIVPPIEQSVTRQPAIGAKPAERYTQLPLSNQPPRTAQPTPREVREPKPTSTPTTTFSPSIPRIANNQTAPTQLPEVAAKASDRASQFELPTAPQAAAMEPTVMAEPTKPNIRREVVTSKPAESIAAPAVTAAPPKTIASSKFEAKELVTIAPQPTSRNDNFATSPVAKPQVAGQTSRLQPSNSRWGEERVLPAEQPAKLAEAPQVIEPQETARKLDTMPAPAAKSLANEPKMQSVSTGPIHVAKVEQPAIEKPQSLPAAKPAPAKPNVAAVAPPRAIAEFERKVTPVPAPRSELASLGAAISNGARVDVEPTPVLRKESGAPAMIENQFVPRDATQPKLVAAKPRTEVTTAPRTTPVVRAAPAPIVEVQPAPVAELPPIVSAERFTAARQVPASRQPMITRRDEVAPPPASIRVSQSATAVGLKGWVSTGSEGATAEESLPPIVTPAQLRRQQAER